ncbi:septal ring lytic transglycosylase RlpA family protein [Haloactinospora alba]|uniref:septal ring lytic transglycosylase RlpA family protein n=1 Tax=Haloactinospora alba TaxID=405555 RepID=UPI001FE41C09|nr:septal ring lytic transglycosylase RlpA family protein [Haloactinospora alba]
MLITGGTAGAAAIGDLAPGPESAAMTVPEADIAGLTPSDPTPGKDGKKDTEGEQEQARESASQSADSTTQQKEEPEEEPQDEENTSASGQSDNGGDSSGSEDLTPTGQSVSCEASMYSEPQPTASGEQFDPSAMTAAHKSLPMDTKVNVTNPSNGKSVTVRINDRGPYVEGRCLDLSTASFEKIASPNAGVTDVQWQVVS